MKFSKKKYYSSLNENFNNLKKNELEKKTNLYNKMMNFISEYENFLINFINLKKNIKIENSLLKIETEIFKMRELITNFDLNFEKCFKLLFQHHASMLCLRCDPDYKNYMKKNKKKKEILNLNEKMCQNLITDCYDYINTITEFAQKAKKVLIHLRKLLLFPKFNNEEIENFKNYEKKIFYYKKCFLKNECRDICVNLIKSYGYNEEGSIPDFYIFKWISDYFNIFEFRLNNLESFLTENEDTGRFLKEIEDIEIEFSTEYVLNTFELAGNIKNVTFVFSFYRIKKCFMIIFIFLFII